MQPQLWSDINWVLIVVLVLASGIFAYLGDVLGTKFGKKRISILGLRPKYTSSIITAFTGILIALVTLSSLAVTSESVRTTLFSMKFLERQINQLTTDLQDSREEQEVLYLDLVQNQEKLEDVQNQLSHSIPKLEKAQEELESLKREKSLLESRVSSLREESEKLREGLIQVRAGKIAVFANEMLAQQPVEKASSIETVGAILERMYQRAGFLIALRLGLKPEDVQVTFDPEDEKEAMHECSNSDTRLFIRILAASNILVGETVRIKFEVHPSKPIFSANELLHSQVVFPPFDESQAEALLHSLLRKVNEKAVSAGVLPDPVNGTVGTLDANDFFEAVQTLSSIEETSVIGIYAQDQAFTEGPVRVIIQIEPYDSSQSQE
ncbi:MAG: DUF3084 domain-containing protein [Synergistales bacterium]|nr:DUF3084 domain-containing protein [Synergistales bacterium]